MDITLGAELRRVANLLEVANTMPLWQRPQYLMERLPQTLLAPEKATDPHRYSSAGLEARPPGIDGKVCANVPQRFERDAK